jgi:hypothetical protein
MSNQRQHTRYIYSTEIELTIDGERRPARTVNISRGGVFIIADPVPAFGGKLVLHIKLPGVPEICDIGCVVRWSKAGEGAGLQFEQLRPIEVWSLNKLLRDLK